MCDLTLKTGIIYDWYFPASELLHPHYIGESFMFNPINRALSHKKKDSKLNERLIGENLTVEKNGILIILHENIETQEETAKLEKEEIIIHNCIFPNGFNFTIGGEYNSEEVIKHIKLMAAKTRAKRNNCSKTQKLKKAEKVILQFPSKQRILYWGCNLINDYL